MTGNKIIIYNNDKMFLFFDLLEKEYNEKENKQDKRININNVLKEVFY